MKKFALVGLFILLAFVSLSYAGKKQATNPCANPQNTIEMRECESKNMKEADAELNKIYKQLMSRIDKNQKDKLKAAELAWIKYRDAHCEFEASFYEGGTMQPQVHSSCLRAMTEKRTKELQEVLNGMG